MKSAKLGQNFLANKNVADKIVRQLLPAKGPILEVGPGKGMLTDLILKYRRANPVKIVELDTNLYYKLKERYADVQDFEVINRNILEVGLDTLYRGMNEINLISNVPYYISLEFTDWLISQAAFLGCGVLMLQKEFVEKITSRPGTKLYNARGIVLRHVFHIEKCFEVNPGSFSPPPKVKSTVFSFSRDAGARTEEVPSYYLFLRESFRNRRKTLLNNLAKKYPSEKIWEVFESHRLNPKVRAEQLPPGDLLAIFRNCMPVG
ncbi:MAG: ribosomal RNA small subunit methyltransferase A [bacterium]|nr:ribosomal RNA small subunit methyltransferase A [bacterium]